MQLLLNRKALSYYERGRPLYLKTLRTMKILCVLLTAASLYLPARGFSQGITIALQNAPLESFFKIVEQQSAYSFVYSKEAIAESKPVSIDAKKENIENVLRIVFANQPLSYSFHEKFIIIKISEKKKDSLIEIRGKVINEDGEAVPGATVFAKLSNKGVSTNERGEFILIAINEDDILTISSVGYYKEEIRVNKENSFVIRLKVAVSKLDEAIVMAYGQTTRRLNTGNISKVTAEEISKQPVSNPLAVLQGRVPGLLITQTSGVPGSSFNVEIRGRSSLDLSLSRNDPLFIIDGVPFEPGNLASNQIVSAANKPGATNLGGLSPFNTINPLDIESIEVLKDADATAIYGSRGANGVIIISTKKGQAGKTKVSANVNFGWSKVTRTMDLLTTPEYLSMRREAFANDGYTPQATVPFGNGWAPDLLILDTTLNTDLKKILLGGTAHTTNAEISLSGGSDNTFFLFGGSFHNETNVFSDDLNDRRGSVHFNINHRSQNRKFETIISGFYSSEKNQLIQTDLTRFINLPPNFVLYDSLGKPAWTQKGIPINYINLVLASMPSAELLREYTSVNENMLGSIQLSYKLFKTLTIRLNSGYNQFSSDEVSTTPKASLNPASSQLAFAKFGHGSSKNWNIDPQVEFWQTIGKVKLNFLLGSTFLERKIKSSFINATNYTSDLLLKSIAAAGQITGSNSTSQYKYTAFFGRMNFNWDNKYLINLSLRRDGSSRFGPEKRFANFGAIGSAWIFSNESFFKTHLKFLSFGKIRFSYGVTGNDQIGNYKYLDLWNSTGTTYQNTPALQPGSLLNPNYEWEKNKKAEAAIELGAFKDRLLISAAYYVNRSSNQLVDYQLPDQTGFTGITLNLPALVENSGVEIVLTTKNISSKNFNWTSFFNLTIPKNKLISFPGLNSSSYATTYQEGKSLSIINKGKFLGVNPTTGHYTVEDYNKDGNISFPADYQFLGDTDPTLYGGFQNTLEYKQFNFSFLFDFRKQTGRNYLAYIFNNQPGLALNQPDIVLQRWQKPGDNVTIQKFSTTFGGPAAQGGRALSNSDGIYSDASFIRLKNIALSYSFPKTFFKKLKLEAGQIYCHAQNLFVITKYKGSDPETQDIYVLPPLRTIVAGILLTF